MKEYSTSEFAKAIGVSRSTLLRMEKKGEIKPHSFSENGYKIFTQKQVDEFLGFEKVEPTEKIENEKKSDTQNNQTEKIIEILERENQFLKDQLQEKDNQLKQKDEIIQREQELRLLADKKIILLENQNIIDEESEKNIADIENEKIKKWWKFWN